MARHSLFLRTIAVGLLVVGASIASTSAAVSTQHQVYRTRKLFEVNKTGDDGPTVGTDENPEPPALSP